MHGLFPYEVLVTDVLKVSKATETIASALGYPP